MNQRMDDGDNSVDNLRRRIERLEEENQRLRGKLEPLIGGPENPCFDAPKFQRLLARVLVLVMIPMYLVPLIAIFPTVLMRSWLPALHIAGVPLFDFAGIGTRHPGVGIGMVAFGGAGIGLVGIGGLGLGVVAMGGGSVGLIALGGGTCGVIAIGGGAVGVIAIGGGACGYYALGQRGAGKHVLALNRQDDQAIEFFCRYFPRLREACTRPMPVIPVQKT
jgi:hypothetical protein